jgi:hypothetical protein
VARDGTCRRSAVLPIAVTIPLPASDSFDTFNSDFGEVVSEVEGATSDGAVEPPAPSLPISLTNDVPQKDEEYFVTYYPSS